MSEKNKGVGISFAKGVAEDWLKEFGKQNAGESYVFKDYSSSKLVSILFCFHPDTEIYIRNKKGERVKYNGTIHFDKDTDDKSTLELMSEEDVNDDEMEK